MTTMMVRNGNEALVDSTTEGGNPGSIATSRKSHMNPNSVKAAADLIKSLDSAFASMNHKSLTAAKDAEEARRNARTASELARLYQQQTPIRSNGGGVSSPPMRFSASTTREYPALRFSTSLSSSSSRASSSIPFMGSNENHTTPYFAETPKANIINRSIGMISPAEDALALSLELERTRQALAEERALHEETKSDLQQALGKNLEFEKQMEEISTQQETERQRHCNIVHELETELLSINGRVEAAEEDAQEALRIATVNVESREQVEEWLQRALEEIQTLRAHMLQQHAPGKNAKQSLEHDKQEDGDEFSEVNGRHKPGPSLETIVEEETDDGSNAYPRPARALVAAGRQLLHRTMKADQPMVFVPSPFDADKRRMRLKERLGAVTPNAGTAIVQSNSSSDDSSFSPHKQPASHHAFGASLEALESCRRTARILKESGRRLKLSGRWWNGETHAGPDELHLESMARHYSIEVEGILDKKCKEIVELESLCTLWELKTVSGASTK